LAGAVFALPDAFAGFAGRLLFTWLICLWVFFMARRLESF
jgi:hypothetical protein